MQFRRGNRRNWFSARESFPRERGSCPLVASFSTLITAIMAAGGVSEILSDRGNRIAVGSFRLHPQIRCMFKRFPNSSSLVNNSLSQLPERLIENFPKQSNFHASPVPGKLPRQWCMKSTVTGNLIENEIQRVWKTPCTQRHALWNGRRESDVPWGLSDKRNLLAGRYLEPEDLFHRDGNSLRDA